MLKSEKRKQYFRLALLILWAVFILSNSMKPASVSGAESQSVLSFVTSLPLLSQMGITEHLIRKGAHFLEYTVFGILVARAKSTYPAGDRRGKLYFSAFLLLFLPLCDETVQLFTDGRAGMIADVWLDFAGGCFGLLLSVLAGFLYERRKKKKLIPEQD